MLERALDAEGRGHWLWVTAEETRNLSLAGLGPSLADAARWLHQPAEARSSLLEAAPPLPAAGRGRRSLPGRPGKILCLGRNFAAHAREMGSEPSLEDMLWFAKFAESCIPHEAELAVPNWLAGRIDPEAELVLLLGAPLQDATPAQAEQAIAAWTLGNDFTARGVQAGDKEKAWPWVRSKNLRGFGSYGPGWLPQDQLPPFEQLRLQGLVNGEVRQEAPLADMLYRPGRALAELSRWVSLETGDLIFLGTPAGVQALEDGDLCEVQLLAEDGSLPLGVLRNRIARASSA